MNGGGSAPVGSADGVAGAEDFCESQLPQAAASKTPIGLGGGSDTSFTNKTVKKLKRA